MILQETQKEAAIREQTAILTLLDKYEKGYVINSTEQDTSRYQLWAETSLKDLQSIISKSN